MSRFARLAATTALALGMLAGAVEAAPVKVGFFTPMSGPLAGIGATYKPTIDYVVGAFNAAGGWNGEKVQVDIYDDAGTTQGSADRMKQALADGVRIIVAGGTSPLGAQNLADIRRWNERNPSDPAMLLVVGAEGSNFIGKDCYFYSFHFTTTPFIRQAALAKAMKEKGALGAKVMSLQPDYTMGREMEQATVDYAKDFGYEVVGTLRHDLFKIRDFSPFIEKVRAANPDTVFTASSQSDLLLILQAASSTGLKSKFAGMFLDEPGNVASAGKAALGNYTAQIFNAEAGGTAGEAYRAEFAKVAGRDPLAFANNSVITLKMLTAALKTLPKADKVDVTKLSAALENVKVEWPLGELSMRAADHQVQLPLVISIVAEDAKYKADGTSMGFKPVKVLSAKETETAVDETCKMARPTN
jgi:branched-chain amino acid transport system substrate-binding protein